MVDVLFASYPECMHPDRLPDLIAHAFAGRWRDAEDLFTRELEGADEATRRAVAVAWTDFLRAGNQSAHAEALLRALDALDLTSRAHADLHIRLARLAADRHDTAGARYHASTSVRLHPTPASTRLVDAVRLLTDSIAGQHVQARAAIVATQLGRALPEERAALPTLLWEALASAGEGCRELGDHKGEAWAAASLGLLAATLDRPDTATPLLRHAQKVAEGCDEPLAWHAAALAWVHLTPEPRAAALRDGLSGRWAERWPHLPPQTLG